MRKATMFLFLIGCGGSPSAPADPPPDMTVSFLNEIAPAFRNGCTGGGCHSAPGSGGLALDGECESMFIELTEEFRADGIAPRVVPEDSTAPEGSYLYQKASGAISHGGGATLSNGSDVLTWIREQAQSDCEVSDD